jgi:hypothetical protein
MCGVAYAISNKKDEMIGLEVAEEYDGRGWPLIGFVAQLSYCFWIVMSATGFGENIANNLGSGTTFIFEYFQESFILY